MGLEATHLGVKSNLAKAEAGFLPCRGEFCIGSLFPHVAPIRKGAVLARLTLAGDGGRFGALQRYQVW